MKWRPKSIFGMLLLGAAVAAVAIALAGGYSGCFTGCNPVEWGYGLFRRAR